MNNILYPQAILHESKIYLLAGLKILTKNYTRKILSIDLDDQSLRIKLENIILPKLFHQVRCISTGREILILGSDLKDETVQ